MIIRGAGRGFSSGYDLDGLAESEETDPCRIACAILLSRVFIMSLRN